MSPPRMNLDLGRSEQIAKHVQPFLFNERAVSTSVTL